MKSFAPLLVSLLLGTFAATAWSAPETATGTSVTVQQIRNATVKIDFSGTTFLVDPMLSAKGEFPGFPGTYRSELKNPLVELPFSAKDVLESVDAVVVTHTHTDHWDEAAQKLIASGESKPDANFPATELAAQTSLALLLLNLDETLTKE